MKIGNDIVDAVDVFVGGQSGPNAKAGTKILEDVPCSDLPRVLEQVIPYVTNKRGCRVTWENGDVNLSVVTPKRDALAGIRVGLLEARLGERAGATSCGASAAWFDRPPAVREASRGLRRSRWRTFLDPPPATPARRVHVFLTGAGATALFQEAERRGT